MKHLYTVSAALLMTFSVALQAHHSFAIFDLTHKISRTGVLTKFALSNPHIMLELKVTHEDGSVEIWDIESNNPRRWEDRGIPPDVAGVGETVTLLGWPTRNGKNFMALSEITTERGTTVIVEEIRQPGVEFITPPPTKTRK